MPRLPLLCVEWNALQLNFVCLSKIIWDTTLLPQTRCGGVALHRLAVDFDPADVHITAVAVAAAWNQICETDFIHLAQVYVFEQIAAGPDLVRIDLYPANVADREFIGMVVGNGPIRMIPDEHGSVSQFDQRPHLVETRHFDVPADFRSAGKVDMITLVAEGQGTGSLA